MKSHTLRSATLHVALIFSGLIGLAFAPRSAAAQSPTYTPLYSFNDGNGDGYSPGGPLLLASDGYLYGTTSSGGALSDGTIFRVDKNGNYTVLYAFGTNPTDGYNTVAPLVQGLSNSGNGIILYGTTPFGGANGVGTIFSIQVSSNGSASFQTLWSFTGGTDGSVPYGPVVQGADGTLYVATSQGGNANNPCGGVFSLTTGPTPTNATIYTFTGLTDGGTPDGGLILGTDKNGNAVLYGTASANGGAGGNGAGTVFALSGSGFSTFTVLHVFNNTTDGGTPLVGVIQSGGYLYGVTAYSGVLPGGAPGSGTIFKLSTDGASYAVLNTFSGSNGLTYNQGLIQGVDGNLYGTTNAGGSGGAGTIFSLTTSAASPNFQTLVSFTSGDVTNGSAPAGSLVQDPSSGLFYGTTSSDGANGNGIIYSLALPVTVTVPPPVVNSTTVTIPYGQQYSYSITVSAGSPLTGYAVSNLPSWLTFNSATGVLSGTPSTVGTYTINLFASNAGGQSTNGATLILTVNPPVPFAAIINPLGLAINPSAILYCVNFNGYRSSSFTGDVVQILSNGSTLLNPPFAYNLNHPSYPAFDASGNLYVSESGTGNIYKITPLGVTTTFVSGFNDPIGVAFDTSGNLYVAESQSNDIKKVSPTGSVTTFASTGFNVPTGLAFDTAGNLYVSNNSGNTVSKVTPAGAVSQFATGFTSPWQLAFDSGGNLYVANDVTAGTISEVGPSGGAATTFASGLTTPTGIAFDSIGDLFVSEFTPSVVVEIHAKPGTYTAPAVPVVNPGTATDVYGSVFGGYSINVSSGTPTSYAASGLPAGLSVNPLTGVITGTPTVSVGTYDVTISATNSVGGTGTATLVLTITPAPLAITASNTSMIYGGSVPALSVTYGGLVNGDTSGSLTTQPTVTTSATNTSSVSGSPYAVTASGAVDANYTISYTAGALAITPATATLAVSGYGVPYNGGSHTATATATGVSGILPSSDFNLAGTVHTNAGTYNGDSWSFADPSGNYFPASGTVNDSITAATVSVTVTGYTVSYDGNAHTASATVSWSGGSLPSSDVTLTGTSHTKAGTYGSDPWSFNDSSGNFVASNGTTSDAITPATVSVTVTPYNVSYDGNAHTASATVTWSGGSLPANDVTLTGTTHTNAGTYGSDPWSFSDSSGNFAVASGTTSDSIAPATVSVTVTPYNVTYDGAAHTASATVTWSGGPLPAGDVTLTGTTHTNAGTYSSDSWSFSDGSGNFAASSGTTSDTIAPAAVTVTVTGYTVTYDGNSHTASATVAWAGGALPAGDVNVAGTSHTTAGTYSADAWNFSDASGNYAAASGTVNDAINKATPTITWANPTDIIWGTALSGTQLNATSVTPGTFAYSPTSGTILSVGPSQSLSVILTPTDTTDYNNAAATVVINVDYANATVTLGDLLQAYDGTAKNATATTNPGGLTVLFAYNGVPEVVAPTAGSVAAYAPAIGQTIYVTVTGDTSGAVFGSGPYAINSDIGAAAVQSGALTSGTTAVLQVNILADQGTYAASTQNGVTSVAEGAAGGSFQIVGVASSGAYTLGPVHAGSTPVTATIVSFDYAGAASNTLVITPATPVLSWAQPADIYSGTALGATQLDPTSSVAGTFSFAPASGTVLSVGQAQPLNATFTPTDAVDYVSGGTVATVINVDSATATITMPPVTQIYTGSPVGDTATVVPTVQGISYIYTGMGTTTYGPSILPPTNAGTYCVTATINDPTYTGSAKATITIGQATPTISVTGYSVIYTGSAHTATGTATGVGGVALSGLNLSGTTHSAVGIYNGDTWSFTDSTGNYINSSGTVNDSISVETVTVTVDSATVTYNGQPQSVLATTFPVGPGLALTYNGSTTPPTAPGTYTVVATVSGTGNYTGSGTGTLIINKANPTISVTGYSVTYTGSAFTATGSAKGVGGVALSGLNLSGTTHTNAGAYNGDAWTFTDTTGDYNNASGTVNDAIAPKAVTVTVNNASVTYNGQPQSVTTSTTPSGVALTITYNGSSTVPTAPGTYAVVATVSGSNCTGTATGTLIIGKATPTISVTGYSVTYTGSSFTATGSAKGVGGIALSGLNLSGTTHTNAGTYNGDAWTFTDTTGDYNNASGTVNDSIAAATVTVTVNSATVTYNGSPHSVTASASTGGLTLTITYNGSAAAPTAAGTYTVAATITGANYTGSGTGTLTINKATPVLAWTTPAAITYGTALGSGQLDATSSVAGSFVYTPASGTVLAAGAGQKLNAVFTPTDTNDYVSGGTVSTTITVNKAAITVAANNQSITAGQAIPTLTYAITGFVNGDTQGTAVSGTPSVTTTATTSSAAGTYTITVAQGSLAAANYSFTLVNGTLTVTASTAECLVWLQGNCGDQANCNGGRGYNNCGGYNLLYNYCNSGGYNSSQTTQTVIGGTVVPVAFALYNCSNSNYRCGSTYGSGCSGQFVADTSTVISIYEVYANGTSSDPVSYGYSATGPNPPNYWILNNEYLLNFPSASGTHHYVVEVDHPQANGSLTLLGTETIYTVSSCLPNPCSGSTKFNSSKIAAGSTIWFSSVINIGCPDNQSAVMVFDSSTITFNANGSAVTLNVPAATIKVDPAATTATSTYNATANTWVTTVPANYSGNVFLTGVSYPVAQTISGGINSLNWSGIFRCDNTAVSGSWQWGAAVYTQFNTNPASLGVKPVDSNTLSQYKNSDLAGTPESYKQYLTSGACGTGGSNYTGTRASCGQVQFGSSCWGNATYFNDWWYTGNCSGFNIGSGGGWGNGGGGGSNCGNGGDGSCDGGWGGGWDNSGNNNCSNSYQWWNYNGW